jgi:two-component system sensor histidine kinase/response regulator
MSTDRAELVHQLQATLSKMEVALGAIADAVVFLSADSQVQWCNSAFEQLVKRSHSTIVGSKFSELLPLMQAGQSVAPDAYPDVKMRRGGYEAREYEFVQGDRSLVLHISGNCMEQGDRSTVLVIRDITQAKQQEAEHKKALQERDESLCLLRATLESTADGILVVNQERSIPLYNQKFLEIWGMPDSLLLAGKEDEPLNFAAQQTKDPEGFIAQVQDIFLHHPQAVIQDVVKLKDGRVLERYSQPRWQSDQIIGRVWNFRDITAYKQTEEALRKSELKYRRLFENSQMGIGRTRIEDGLILDANQRFIEILGYRDASEVIGKKSKAELYLNPRDREFVLHQLHQSGELNNYEVQFRRRDGSIAWVLLSLRLNTEEHCIEAVITDISARKRTEIALAESEFKFRTIVENANDVLGILDLEGLIRYISPNVVNLIGFTPAELEGQTFDPFVYPDDLPKLREVYHRLATTGERISGIEYRTKHKDGRCIWQLSNLSSFRDVNGELLIIGVVRDITERKQAEEALKASETRLNAILSSAVASIQRNRLYSDRTWEFEYISPGSELIYGYTAEEILADKYLLASRVHPEDWETVILPMFDNIFAEQPGEHEYRYLHPDGIWRWICMNVTSSRDEALDCWMVNIIATDITDKKRTEIALAESEFKFRSIVENANDVLSILSLDGIVQYVSPNIVNIAGFTRLEVEGKYLSNVHPDDVPQIQEAFNRLATTGQRVSGIECRSRHKDGSWRWFSNNMSAYRDSNGELLIIGTSRDITERKQIEEALKTSQARLNTILNSALAVINRIRVYANREWEFEYISPGSIELWGYSPEELMADKTPYLSRHVPEELAIIYENTFNQIFLEGTDRGEYRYHHPDGKWRWFSFYTSSVRDEATDCWIATSITTDITARKQAEEALKASEARLNAILSSLVACIQRSRIYANRDWNYEYVSAGSLQLWGYSPEELIADKNLILSRHVPEDLERIHQNVFDRIFVEGTYEGEYRYHHPDGRLRWISFNMNSVRDEATDCWICTGIATDITARKLAEAELERRVRVERLLSSISRHFIDQDVDTAINFTLEAIANFIGCDRSYIFEFSDDQKQYYLAREWCAAGIPARSDDGRVGNLTMFPWVYEQMLNHQAIAISSLAEFPPEAIAERAIFQRQSIESMLVVPMTHSDKVVGCLGVEVVRSSKTWTQDDINFLKLVGELIAIGCARHKAEEALLVAKEAAEAANRAKSSFLANMSHELRTPLNAILGFAQLMERDTTLTSRHRNSLAIINRSGEHLLNLINDVLEMSKIEAGRLVLSPEAVNLHRLFQTLQEMFQVRTQAKRLSLRFELAPDLPQCVLTDEGKLRQVLINLLSNAVKFTQTGGITLRARAEQGNQGKSPMPYTLFFEVEDTGKGIASEEMGNLFQPFVQTTSGIEAREGTGLGLTISRQFIRLMGGDIYLTSTVGKGSTFRFDIQVTLADAKAVAPTLTHRRVLQLAPDQPTYRILVVDDRPESRDLLAQLLGTVGFETRSATNGQEAIQEWQQWHPHLIWMDMRMPVMDGYEATRQIRAQEARGRGNSTHPLNPVLHQPTIIIALTASAFEEQRASILAAGCDDFVRKPFREQVIFLKMAEYLGVQYVYEQNPDSQGLQQQTNRGDRKNLTSDDLAVMPADWVSQLHQAALEVDADQILQLIEQIPVTHLALAEGLTDLVNRFGFDEILELSEENCNF